MIKRHPFIITLAAIFVILSVFIYLTHYLIFRDVHHIFIYLVGDLAFLPLEVFLVVIVIERILTRREKQAKLQKLNMVIGAFFSEVGNHLLQYLLEHFNNKEEIASHLNVAGAWTRKDFQQADDFAYDLPIDVNIQSLDLGQLKDFLSRVSLDFAGEPQPPRARPIHQSFMGSYAPRRGARGKAIPNRSIR